MSVGYHRNRELVQLSSDVIPPHVTQQIINSWENYEYRDRSGILPYFIANKLKLLTNKIEDF